MPKSALLAAALSLAVPSLAAPAAAQEVVHWSAPAAPARGEQAYFPMGTPVRLATRVELSSKDARPGDRVYLTVAEPLVYRGQTVVPAGALAVGEVTRVDRTGEFGKRGRLGLHLLTLQTPEGPVALSGKAERAGKGQAVLAIGGGTLVWWPMLLIHGTSARLPADSVVTAYLADDLGFAVRPDAPRVADLAVRIVPASFTPAAR